MTKIKAIFFDIDGTLRSFKTKTIPENTKKTLRALREKGMKLFTSTFSYHIFKRFNRF